MTEPGLLLSAEPKENLPGGKVFTVGTLRYTKGGLWLLFSWLMWNDLCLMLMERVAPTLVPFLLKDHGASNTQIAFYTSTLTGAFTIWINPVVSTWSDRYRSPAGRRRPFLLFATPFCALALAALPFMPDVFSAFDHTALHRFWAAHPAAGMSAFIGIGFLVYQIFNSVILAIFTYYFWDVVPESVLGRFSSLTKVVSTFAVFIWDYFLFGLSENHMKGVCIGVAAFFFIAYVVSIWQVKEGEYPPPPERARRGPVEVVRSYIEDCFTPYYLWFIFANCVYQIGNLSNGGQMLLYRYQLHLSFDVIGKMKSIPTLLVVLVGYSMGSLVDRLKPGRVLIVSVALYGCANLLGFIFVNGKWTMFFYAGLVGVIVCALGIAQSVFTVEFFPRAKLGQFCSANAMTSAVANLMIAPVVGMMFDWLNNNYRYNFLWSSCFYFLSVPLYAKAYLNWRRVQAVGGKLLNEIAPAEAIAITEVE